MQAGRASWERLVVLIRRMVADNWQRLLGWRGRLRLSEEALHLMLAGVVGVVSGISNFLFYLATESLKWAVLQHGGDPVEITEMLAPWARLAAPALGGLAAGLVLHWGLRFVGPQGSTNLLEVVVAGDGRLPFRSTLVKTVSSLISFGTGASIGREGSLIHLSSTLSSKLGQLVNAPPYRLRLLVACGAAAGLAASYNAPIAGAVFAAQIVLGSFAMNLFAPLVCASVVAAVVSRSFFGIAPWYRVPDFEFTRLIQLPWFLVLGALSGALGAAFLRLLRQSELAFQRTGLPVGARIFVAGIVVGALAIGLPQVCGNGYSVTSRLLADDARYGLVFVGLLLVAKLAATTVTVGAGTVGGVFTPTLFLGAALGSVFGHGLQALGWAGALPTGTFALVGMGSTLAATTHSPLLAIILVFEISLNYSLMPALMLACAVGTLVGRRLHPVSVYTEPLRQKGLLDQAATDRLGVDLEQTIGDLMLSPVPPVRETTSFRDIADRFLTSPNNFLPVINDERRLVGVVALQDLKGWLNSGDLLRGVIALDVMRPPPACLTPNLKLQEALPILLASEMRNIPVINNRHERQLLGSVPRSEALGRLSEAIASRNP